MRAFTTFAAGAGAAEAYAAKAGEVGATTHVAELPLPEGANPSKLATWIQRVAQDPDALPEVPAADAPVVEDAAGRIRDGETCIALHVTGELADRMRTRLGAGEGDRVWLLFGLVDA